MPKLNIKDINKDKLFFKLYNHIQNNTTFGNPDKALKNLEEAQELLAKHKHDYAGFNLYCDLKGDDVDSTLFETLYGAGSFSAIVEELRNENPSAQKTAVAQSVSSPSVISTPTPSHTHTQQETKVAREQSNTSNFSSWDAMAQLNRDTFAHLLASLDEMETKADKDSLASYVAKWKNHPPIPADAVWNDPTFLDFKWKSTKKAATSVVPLPKLEPVPSNITPQQRNDVIVKFLNEIHDPLYDLKEAYLEFAKDTKIHAEKLKLSVGKPLDIQLNVHSVYGWRTGDAAYGWEFSNGVRNHMPSNIKSEPNAIHYHWPSHRDPVSAFGHFPLISGFCIGGSEINAAKIRDLPKIVNGVELPSDFIAEFKKHMPKLFYTESERSIVQVIDNQDFLQKLYAVAIAYQSCKKLQKDQVAVQSTSLTSSASSLSLNATAPTAAPVLLSSALTSNTSVVSAKPTVQERNQAIVNFLNEVHDPLAELRKQIPGNTAQNSEFAWHLTGNRKAQNGSTKNLAPNPNGIHFKFASLKYRMTQMAKLQMGCNFGIEKAIRRNFSDFAKTCGFTDEFIQEFNRNLLGGDYVSDKYQYCYDIIDQRFLDKLYTMAKTYYECKQAAEKFSSRMSA